MVQVIFRKEYDFILGDCALDVFDFFEVDEMHGLSRSACIKRMAEGGTYIDGLANYNPTDALAKPFVFINRKALKKTHEDVTLLMHEMVHMGLLLNDWDVLEKEEEIVTWAEAETNIIFGRYFS
jgi:hypothetical protein